MKKSIAKAYDTIRLYGDELSILVLDVEYIEDETMDSGGYHYACEDGSYVAEYDIIEVNGKNIKENK